MSPRQAVLTLLVLPAVTSVAVGQQPRVAVVDFRAVGADRATAEAVSELLCTELAMAGTFRVVERAALRRLLDERRLRASDLAESQAAALAKLAGADRVLVGSVLKTGKILTVATRLIDVATGEVTMARSVAGRTDNDIPRMCRELAASMGQTGADFGAQVLREILAQAGFEVSPRKRNPDGTMQVTVTYWLKSQ